MLFNKYSYLNGRTKCIIVALFSIFQYSSSAQELEPRALTNVPAGYNFVLGAYGYSTGNILPDPSIPIDDFNGKIHAAGFAYARSIELFGHYAKLDVVVPFADGSWTGQLEGEPRTRDITGMADMRLRFSMNLIGGKVGTHNANTPVVAGFSVLVIGPTGQYDEERLVNLGANRFSIRTQFGVSRQFEKWIIETYAGLWLYTRNNDFWSGNTFQQEPLGVLKLHMIRKLKSTDWLAFDIGYALGGRPIINDDLRDARISTMRLGFTYAMNLGKGHVLRAFLVSGIRFEKGPDFDGGGISYMYRWGKQKQALKTE